MKIRTASEMAADRIDCELCRLEYRTLDARLGLEALAALSKARVEVRKHMHPDDKKLTPG